MGETHEIKIDNSARATLAINDKFVQYMGSGWQKDSLPVTETAAVAEYAAQRRASVSAAFPGKRLVIAAGQMKQRANDTFYLFRANTSFSHLTGWGADAEPGAVLVFEPVQQANSELGHEITLYYAPSADHTNAEFFSNAEAGEFWVGPKPTLAATSKRLGIECRPLHEFVSSNADLTLADKQLATFLDELRLVKDDYEIAQMQLAVDATGRGFDDVMTKIGDALDAERGERVIETVFHARARVEGNWEGYDTIAAAGAHACTLHWVRNTGKVEPGQLLLLDAGVEVDSLYTADITRTVPISGKFNDLQRKVYEAVLEAADAAFAVVKPGIKFYEVHNAAMRVIESKIKQWGLWPENPDPEVPYHKRYMVHGTSHHLGLDVHDCAQAKREMYNGGTLAEGMIFTIEPGLYFHPGDTTVPEEYWGIGVRIEDDIVVTADGARNLSAHIPRTVAAVEEWVSRSRSL